MSRLRSLLRNLFSRDRVERDLDAEMRAMLDVLTTEKMRAGMERSAARRAAGLELGIESVKMQVREARSGASLDAFSRDLRHAVRLLLRNPLFAIVAALSLAIGIGADTAVFTIASALLRFSPDAVAEPERLVEIGRRFDGLPFGFNPGSYPDYLDIRRRTTTLEHVFAHPLFPQNMTLTASSGLDSVVADVVTTNYFAALGTRAAIGRVLTPSDSDQPGASPFVVLSHHLWLRMFGGAPDVVGTTVRLNRYPVTVIGVAPEGFQGTTIVAADVWVPMSVMTFVTGAPATQLDSRKAGWLVMGARLKPGASLAQAEADLAAIDRGLREEFPDQQNPRALRIQKASPVAGNGPVAVVFVVLLAGLTSTVLVIACANVAGLLLARASGRRREMALRLAIGAGRSRIVRQLMTETLLLFVLGATIGIAVARITTLSLVSILPTLPLPVRLSVALDWHALAFAAGLSLIAALLSGLAPALHASKTDVATVLKDESQGPRLRLRSVFVVAQIALSLVLIVIGGLFVRALQEARSRDAGFDERAVEVASIDYSTADAASGLAFARDLLDRIRALPGVEHASIARTLPLATETLGFGVALPGATPLPGQTSAEVFASGNIVEPGYFAAMRIPLLAGRDFTERDVDGAPLVVIVGDAAAHRFWPGQNAVGQRLVVSGVARTRAEMQVVGVARDLPYSSLASGPIPFVYVPLRQNYSPEMTVVVRTGDGQRVADRLRGLVRTMNASLPQVGVRPLGDVLAVALLPQRLGAVVAGGLGIIGILLAAMGIYGVTAYSVARRTREIAIRTALGASREAVIMLALRQALSLAAIGSAIGVLLAVIAGQVLSMLLIGVSPIDPGAVLGAMLLCGLVVLAACAFPVHRAVRIAAADALRAE